VLTTALKCSAEVICKDCIINAKETGCSDVDWIELAHNTVYGDLL